jgi:putative PEP-CTERM system TPR-repeat lipoprotein
MSLAIVLLSACSKSPEQLVASGKAYIDKGDYKAATLELRSALQQQPESAEARYLLGLALLETRDPLGAEKELRKATELGYPQEKALPQLAKVMLTLRQADKVVAEFGGKQLSEPAANAELLATVGNAYLATGKRTEAAAAYAKALAAQPGHAAAKLGQARLAALDRDFDRAEQIAGEVATQSPSSTAAWTFKAQLALANQKGEEAVSNYRKALEAEPEDLDARLSLGLLLLQQDNDDGAAREADAMARVAKEDPRTLYLQSQIARKQRKYAEARDLALKVLRAYPGHIPSLRTAGISYFFLGSDQQAQDQLRKAVEGNKSDLVARRLLIASYLRSGDLPRAKRTLKESLELAPKDPGLLVLSGEVAVAERDLEGATHAYEAALAGGLDSAASMARLGQLQLAAGESSEAIRMLEAASAASDQQYQSDVLLVLVNLRQNKPAEALKWVEKIEKKQPEDPVGPTLRGGVLLASKDESGARASFEKALQLRPTHVPALVALARLDLQANNPTAAGKRFQAALSKEPNDESVTLAYASFLQSQKAPVEQRKELLANLVKNQPGSIRGRMLLIATLIDAGQAQDAVTIASQGLATDPEDPTLLRALGAAQLAAGNMSQGVAAFSKLSELQPQSPIPPTLVAYAYFKAGDERRALDALERALKIKPDYLSAQLAAARLYFKAKDLDAALRIARDIERQRPKVPTGYSVEADLLGSAKRWAEADRILKQGLAEAPSGTLAAKRHSLLLQSGKEQAAKEFASEWLAGHPEDAQFRGYLADRALWAADYAQAADQYRAILASSPNNTIALNNLAWASAKLNDPKALEYAEKAYALAPNAPAVMDTLGWMLVERGQVSRGLELLRKAVEGAPHSDDIRLNLAKGLIRAGDKEAGRRELEVLAKKGDGFPRQREVQELLSAK